MTSPRSFVFLLIFSFITSRTVVADDNIYSKEHACSLLRIFLIQNLKAEQIEVGAINCDLHQKDDGVMDFAVEVFTNYDAPDALKYENVRIASLALQGAGELTKKTVWRSRYLKLVIDMGEKAAGKRWIDYEFKTAECRDYHTILLSRNKEQAAKALLMTLAIAKKRAEADPHY